MEKISDLTFNGYSLQVNGITQSLLTIYLQCRVKFLLKVNRYYIPATSTALHFGSMVHTLLEQYYKTGKYDSANYKSDEIVIDQQEVERQKAVAEALLNVYVKVYKDSFTNIEETLAVKFNGVTLRLKIDGIDKNYVVDHKTKSRIDEDALLDVLTFDFQSLFYITALELHFKKDFKGAYNNIIRNPAHKQGKDTLKDFQVRLQSEIEAEPDHFFKRFKIPFTKQDKSVYKTELAYKLDEIQKVIDGELPIYKNESSCVSGYGNCTFLKTCALGNTSLCKQRSTVFPELKI